MKCNMQYHSSILIFLLLIFALIMILFIKHIDFDYFKYFNLPVLFLYCQFLLSDSCQLLTLYNVLNSLKFDYVSFDKCHGHGSKQALRSNFIFKKPFTFTINAYIQNFIGNFVIHNNGIFKSVYEYYSGGNGIILRTLYGLSNFNKDL